MSSINHLIYPIVVEIAEDVDVGMYFGIFQVRLFLLRMLLTAFAGLRRC